MNVSPNCTICSPCLLSRQISEKVSPPPFPFVVSLSHPLPPSPLQQSVGSRRTSRARDGLDPEEGDRERDGEAEAERVGERDGGETEGSRKKKAAQQVRSLSIFLW